MIKYMLDTFVTRMFGNVHVED